MKIMLIGGGSGGHITPLLAVARELKLLNSSVKLLAVCEKGSKFVDLYKNCPEIAEVYQVPAGKYRRYGGQSLLKTVTDVKTLAQNGRDVFKTLKGYSQAKKLLKKQRPDILIIKGGFVAVPMGLAAAKLKIPFITHDSDSIPGLANRIISKWALLHATGMPTELYEYSEATTRYVGIPVSKEYKLVGQPEILEYRRKLGLTDSRLVITLIGGSQGGEQLNQDMVAISKELLERYQGLRILHIAGQGHQESTKFSYKNLLGETSQNHVKVVGFTSELAKYTGVADVVVSRASATSLAELAVQAKPVVVVPGLLAGSHQEKNADYLAGNKSALVAKHADREEMLEAITKFLDQPELRQAYARNLNTMAKPDAARELAELTLQAING